MTRSPGLDPRPRKTAIEIWPQLARMLLGLMLAAVVAGSAAAQLDATRGLPTNRNAPIVLRADEIEHNSDLGLTIARGNVELSQNGDVLLADTVTYNQRTDTITASGHVSLSRPTGEILFADYLELRNAMGDGFAESVRMLLTDRSRLAANTARITNKNRTELRRAVYSPCDLCKNDPSAPPAWQFEAREIDDDREFKTIEMHDVAMQIDGWPIFYFPYLSMPDPTVKRASGFLTPSFGGSSTVGANITLPYFLVLGPDKDITLSPRITTKAGPVFETEYRQQFGNGTLDALGSINYSNPNQAGLSGGELRGNINETSEFDITPDWRTGLDLQRVSDQSYLLQFGFGNPPLNAEISHAFVQGFGLNSGTDVDAYAFQPLVTGLKAATQPIVLPVINHFWQSDPDALGGRWNINENLLDIVRQQGTQDRRISLGSRYENTFRDGIGGQYEFTASTRGDAYWVNDLSQLSNPDLPSVYFPIDGMPAAEPVNPNFLDGRIYPQVGLTWSYPLIHPGRLTPLIEPTVGVYAAPNGGNQRKIPDEDSLSFDYDASMLFRPDRLAGYDILDTGQRVDYGLKLGLYDNSGGSYRALVGQSYRAEVNPFLPVTSGAYNRLSDVVGRVVLQPSSYLDLIYRFRLAATNLAFNEQEASVATGPNNLKLSATYVLIPPQSATDVVVNSTSGQSIIYGKQEQLTFNATAQLTRYWSLQGSETLNLTASSNIINGVVTPQAANNSLYASLSAIYQDECMAFVGAITQSGITNGAVTPGYSVLFSIVFKNIGEFGGTVATLGGTPQ
ncbi:MAG TPA: LPS assembly protein LptD [Stellaceae bacterium]|nr:LPS assembly protein LptD [Stellaceae bacterium]